MSSQPVGLTDWAVTLLRVALGVMFLAHGVVLKLFAYGLPGALFVNNGPSPRPSPASAGEGADLLPLPLRERAGVRAWAHNGRVFGRPGDGALAFARSRWPGLLIGERK